MPQPVAIRWRVAGAMRRLAGMNSAFTPAIIIHLAAALAALFLGAVVFLGRMLWSALSLI